MDNNTAIVLAAAITALPGTGALILAAIAARRSKANGDVLAVIAPRVEQVEKQTNHMQEVMQAQATTLGIRTGQDEERSNPTLPGTPSPKLPEELKPS